VSSSHDKVRKFLDDKIAEHTPCTTVGTAAALAEAMVTLAAYPSEMFKNAFGFAFFPAGLEGTSERAQRCRDALRAYLAAQDDAAKLAMLETTLAHRFANKREEAEACLRELLELPQPPAKKQRTTASKIVVTFPVTKVELGGAAIAKGPRLARFDGVELDDDPSHFLTDVPYLSDVPGLRDARLALAYLAATKTLAARLTLDVERRLDAAELRTLREELLVGFGENFDDGDFGWRTDDAAIYVDYTVVAALDVEAQPKAKKRYQGQRSASKRSRG
jgi:hypothetical protein